MLPTALLNLAKPGKHSGRRYLTGTSLILFLSIPFGQKVSENDRLLRQRSAG
jgi:hypothetical protein